MPYRAELLPGVRGDAFERAIPLKFPGMPVAGKETPLIPIPADFLSLIMDTYPVMAADFRATAAASTALISLSSADGGIRIEPAYPLDDGTVGPALVLKFTAQQTQNVIQTCVWDIEFSGPGIGPDTWLTGNWKIGQDVTRRTSPDVGPIEGPIET